MSKGTEIDVAPARRALRRNKSVFLGVGLFSGFINILALAGSFYMLQIYDRILPSHSVPTLVALTALLFGLYLVYGMLDVVRVRIMGRVGVRFDRELREPVYGSIHKLPLYVQSNSDGLQPIRDLDQIRSFLSGLGPTAFFDLPWVPIYLLAIYLLHPVLGLFAFAGAMLLVCLTVLTDLKSARPMREAASGSSERIALGEETRRNAEVIRAMGLGHHLGERWRTINEKHLGYQLAASDAVTGFGTASKVARLALQSGILGLGAYLVIRGEVSAGTIIAGSIIMSRALAPIETSIAHWRGFVAARQSYRRLNEMFGALDGEEGQRFDLPPPESSLRVENLSAGPPGGRMPIIRGISFELTAGEGLGVIGPSAAGKSTLARAIVGVWRPMPMGGSVRLDGAALEQWEPDVLGRHIGYLPQDVELFSGTVAENICRFDTQATNKMIVTAAKAAGIHDMVVHLSDGYQAQVGEAGRYLSAGQRQRVALARALYRDPFLVVLDEPNSNLDSAGETALASAIKSVRQRGGIVIVVAHRPSALEAVDQVLALANGMVAKLGPKDEVLRNFVRPSSQTVAPEPARQVESGVAGFPWLRVVPEDGKENTE